jgi:FMNH2-dependent dimethyl sulfone monooxygenase
MNKDAKDEATTIPAKTQPTSAHTALERILKQPLILGLFLPHQQGAWSPSTAPRGTSWTFDYNARCAVRADELGFDLVFGLAQWLSKGGYGGEMRYREQAIDPFVATAGLAPLTRNVLLIATVHILYGWHPLHLAKYGAMIDQMSGGRWGLNVVTGYKPSEFRMFGLPQIEHDLRYEMAGEFTTIMNRLWSEDEDLTVAGRWWQTEKAFVAPKPVNRRVVLVNAASSGAGLDYAARYSDIIFVTSPAGADPAAACAALPAHTARIKALARESGRNVRILINPHVICRDTEAQAQARYREIADNADPVAVTNFHTSISGGDTASWKGLQKDSMAVGGNVHLVGTPEQIVEWFIRLKKAGCDGVQVNFFDYEPELEYFGQRVLPLMRQAGLRL